MGVAVTAVCSGMIAYLVFLGDTASREQIVFWQLGSFNSAAAGSTSPSRPRASSAGSTGLLLLSSNSTCSPW